MGKDGTRRWRQWTEQEAREALEELASSGESTASFARGKGVSTQRLAYWRKRLGRVAVPAFVAVELPTGSSRTCIEIAAAGVVVRVREDLDVEHVARLAEAIARRVGGAC
jgi:hypothetical protein